MNPWLRWTCLTLVAGLLAVLLFGAGYVVGSIAPLPWLRPANAASPIALAPTPAPPATETATAPPPPTPTPTDPPTLTPAPSVTPFPTPTERATVPRPTTRAPSLPPTTDTDVDKAFTAFRETWDLIHNEFLNRPIDDVKLIRGAIQGMVKTLDDPYTGYNDPEEFKRMTDDLSGQYEGIGIEVADRNGKVIIIAPIAGSPAEQAGLRPGDTIVKVNDRSVSGLSVAELGALIRGPAGTVIKLSVQREGVPDPVDYSITRARIATKNVETKDLPAQARDAGIMYVRLANFGSRSANDMRDTLRLIMASSPRGLILDLRGNPGGGLFAAIDIVSQFIGDGVVMYEEDADAKRQTFTARAGGLATRVPLAVLIDKGSASASEIVAGAIKDRGRGTLIGETTFGKGTVQNWHTLQNQQGGVRLTIARWLTPNGTWVHGQGVAPDIVVARTTDDRAAGRDPQLDRAIQHLLGK